jgi:dTDP-4-dehydrorhamnose 3,5-epimerase
MKFHELPLNGAALIEFAPRIDDRGSFTRVFCADTLRDGVGLSKPLKHINHSVTVKKGAVRGLRYQVEPALEAKIVRCLRGKTFDVIVDLRRGSPTFLQFSATVLKPDMAVYVPEGFAHGFQTLEDGAEVMYMTTEPYNKECERSVCWSDPRLGIAWPLEVTDISEHDAAVPLLDEGFEGI